MAARSSAPEKRPGFFSQLRTLYTFTQKAFPWLPYLLVGILLLGIAAGVGRRVSSFRRSRSGASCSGASPASCSASSPPS